MFNLYCRGDLEFPSEPCERHHWLTTIIQNNRAKISGTTTGGTSQAPTRSLSVIAAPPDKRSPSQNAPGSNPPIDNYFFASLGLSAGAIGLTWGCGCGATGVAGFCSVLEPETGILVI